MLINKIYKLSKCLPVPPSSPRFSLLLCAGKAKEIVIYKFITPPLLRPPRRLAHLYLGRLLACSSPPSALPQVSLARKKCSCCCCCCCWHLFACCYQVYLGAQQQQKLTRRSSSSSVGSAGDVLRLLAPFLGRVLCMRLGWVARQNSFVNTRSQHTHRHTHTQTDCHTHTRTRTQRP